MGERKVINRYISPDFDPKIMPKIKKSKGPWQCEIRNMIPFSMQCNTCAEYMYAGKKFNMKMEPAPEKTYLGIKVYRFYLKCAVCSSMITYFTDPKNTGYELESGASRNYEEWKEREKESQEAQREREEEDRLDSMKALENRTLDSKNEIDIMDALDEIKAVNQRHEKLDMNSMLDYLYEKHRKKNEEDNGESSPISLMVEMDRMVEEFKASQAERKARLIEESVGNNGLESAALESSTADSRLNKESKTRSLFDADHHTKSSSGLSISIGVVAKKKRKVDTDANNAIAAVEVVAVDPIPVVTSGGIASLLGAYSDSD